ncbi:NAD-dependent epimerase/dehydratase family protein [Ochrobactrum sp. XJ1]|nr:NAD-dependent epimerase/dehydratase family protein [Ochrobactrum sp. XJ1]
MRLRISRMSPHSPPCWSEEWLGMNSLSSGIAGRFHRYSIVTSIQLGTESAITSQQRYARRNRNMKNITVFGATGMLGKPVTQELVRAGYNVTTLVLDPDDAAAMLPSDVRLVKGDLQNIDAIQAATAGADGVYISVSNKNMGSKFNAERQGVGIILTVAKEMNVGQVVFLFSFLARNYQGDWWVYRDNKGSFAGGAESYAKALATYIRR